MDAPRFAVCGETVHVDNFVTEPGGKGYNQAVAAARLGADAVFITAVGDDDYGGMCDGFLSAEGILKRHILTIPKQRTACAFVINSKDGQSEVYVYPGAIRHLTAEYVKQHSDVIKKSKLLILQNEIPQEALCAAVDIAFNAGVEIIFNPAPAHDIPIEIFKKVNCITPNETEAAILTGQNPGRKLDVESAIKTLHGFGVKNVVITLGKDGAAFSDGEGTTFVPALNVEVISTTGAGDCFNAALAVKLSKTGDYLQSVRYAVAASGVSVSRHGVIGSFPYEDEV
jgi:ribokinase